VLLWLEVTPPVCRPLCFVLVCTQRTHCAGFIECFTLPEEEELIKNRPTVGIGLANTTIRVLNVTSGTQMRKIKELSYIRTKACSATPRDAE
jgi:hypothetical protein